MIQGIKNLVFSQPHVRQNPTLICTFKNFCQNADSNGKVFERANLANAQKEFDNNYNFSNNIFKFANTSINLKKEVKRQDKKDCVKSKENKIKSVSFYFCDRKLRNFNAPKIISRTPGTAWSALFGAWVSQYLDYKYSCSTTLFIYKQIKLITAK